MAKWSDLSSLGLKMSQVREVENWLRVRIEDDIKELREDLASARAEIERLKAAIDGGLLAANVELRADNARLRALLGEARVEINWWRDSHECCEHSKDLLTRIDAELNRGDV